MNVCTEWTECTECQACWESEGDTICPSCQFDLEHPIDPNVRRAMMRAALGVKL